MGFGELQHKFTEMTSELRSPVTPHSIAVGVLIHRKEISQHMNG